MTGPTLKIEISAPGQKAVQASVDTVLSLASALRDLPKASAELAKLQQALTGGTVRTGGLRSGANELKELVGEIKNLGAQLNTSFASLEASINSGWAKAAKAQTEGEAKVAAARKRPTVSYQTPGMAAEGLGPKTVDLQWFAQLQTGSLKVAESIEKSQERIRLAAESAYGKSIATLEVLTAREMKAATQPAYQAAGPGWWERALAEQEKGAAKLEAAYQKSIASLETLVTKQMKAATQPAYQAAGPGWWERALAEQEKGAAKLEAAYQKSIASLETLVTKQMKAATQPAYQAAGPGWWERALAEQEKGAAKLEAAYQKSIASLETLVTKQMKAATQPAYQAAGPAWWTEVLEQQEAALLKAQRLEAQWAASSARARANTTLSARSQLSAGIAPESVAAQFGNTALLAAQNTTLEKSYAAVHGEIEKGVPKFRGLAGAMNDAHSAARGLASGFGAMFLTWGNIGPLLAGAALSHSFVQSIKIGAEARQDLETIRVLSDESTTAVALLEKQMISLAQNGPFGPREVSEAMKTLSLAGLTTVEVAQTLKPALDLAVTGGVSITKAAESLVAIGTAYGYSAGQFASVADAVTKAAAISMSSVNDMMASFRTASVVAQQYNVSLKDTSTGLAILANIGIRGTAAGTAFRQMYSELSGASSTTRKEMQALGVQVYDTSVNGTRGMRPLLDIVSDLNKALANKNVEGYNRAIQALSNERGAKSIVALLAALQTPGKGSEEGGSPVLAKTTEQVKELGKVADSELGRIRKLIEESAGFNAISAAQLVATPLNQMKSVASAFQASLDQAFKAIEPTILVITEKLKTAFNSADFTGLVSGLASSIANATLFVVEHEHALKLLVQGYIAWKGATLGIAVVNSLIAGGTVLLNAWRVASLGVAAAQAAMNATAGLSLYQQAVVGVTAALEAMGVAAGVARVAMLFLGPIAAAIGIAAAAWTVYSITSAKASATEEDAASVKKRLTNQSLDDEIERLKLVRTELLKTTDARVADMLAQRNQEVLEKTRAFNLKAQPIRERIAGAENLLGQAQAFSGVGIDQQQQQDAEIARAQDNLDKAQAELYALEKATFLSRDELAKQAAKARQVADLTTEVESLRSKPLRRVGPEGPPDSNAGLHASQDLANAQKAFQDEKTLAQQAARQQQEILDIRHKGMLVSDAAYALTSEGISESLYQKELDALQKFIVASQQELEVLRSDPKKKGKVDATVQKQEAEIDKAIQERAYLQERSAVRLEAANNLRVHGLDLELAKLKESVDLQQAQLDTSVQQLQLMPEEVAAQQAANAARAEGVKIIRKTADELAAARAELDRMKADLGPGEQGSQVDALQAQVRRLETALANAQAVIDQQANRAGGVARSKYLEDNKANWQKYIEEGENATRVLRKSRDDFMNSWVDQGRSVWEEFVKTGHASFKSLKDLFVKTLADITYQRFIVKPFSQIGENVFDRFLKPMTSVEGGQSADKALQDLRGTTEGLGDAMRKLGTNFYELFLEAARGLAVMLQTNGAGGLGGWLSSLVGPGKGDGTVPSPDIAGSPAASAKGSWFDGSAYAFAHGGVMANKVYDSPQFFKFGAGGTSLGVLGEAGRAEAVVPLSRMGNGDLGVKMAGGSGSGVQVTNKTSIVVEDHSGGAQVQQSTGPDGSDMYRIIVGAAAKDVLKGGALRKSIQKVTRSGNNLPRY